MSDGSSILLTHWDPGFYEPNADPFCIADLALNALLYDRVVVRAVDLVMNRFVAKRLHTNPADFELFRELIDHGCVTILTTGPEDYSDWELQQIATRRPIRARALDQFRYRSHAGEPWRPEEWQWDFCDMLDRALGNDFKHPSVMQARRPPKENDFAAQLAEILRDRVRYGLAGMDQFSDIDDRIAEEFIRFCTEPDYFKRFLADDPNASPRNAFFRHEAYQCARHFPNPHGMMNLAQSVYMGLECEREGTDGRFGRKLWEPPFRFNSTAEQEGALERGRCIELVPKRRSIPLALRPGLGKALALTRESKQFRQLQEDFRTWDMSSALEFADAHLTAVAETFADSAGKAMIAPGPAEQWARISVVALCVSARCFGYSFHLPPVGAVDLDPVAWWLFSNQAARLAGDMVHIVRSGAFSRGVGEQVRRALTVRSGTIQFPSSAAGATEKKG